MTMPTITVPGLDRPLSRLIQGAMMLREGDELESSLALLDAAYARGITTFDLAQVYGGGTCDRVFGTWVRDRGLVGRVVMVAKGCHHSRDRKRVTPYDLEADIADSLARTGLPRLDLWLFHRDDPAQAVGPLVEACTQAVRDGRIRAWGCSNWTVARLQAAIDHARTHDLIAPVVNSPNFSLAAQLASPWGDDCITISGPDHAEDRAWHATSGLPVLAWSSLARGFLAGGLTRATCAAMADRYEEHVLRCYVSEANWQRQERAMALARERSLSLPQVALAYVLNQDFPTCAMVGARSAAEMDDNLGALACPLDQATVRWLESGD